MKKYLKTLFIPFIIAFTLIYTSTCFCSSEEEEEISLIFYGDSRTVDLSMCAGGCVYVGKVAAGYDWMSGEGYDLLKGTMSSYPDASIVFCFGVNDMGNVDSYIQFFKEFKDSYPERKAYFASVNPVVDNIAAANGYNVRNAQVEEFNEKVEEKLEDDYLDVYSFLINGGYDTQDGVHFGSDTYIKIQNLVKILVSAEENTKFE